MPSITEAITANKWTLSLKIADGAYADISVRSLDFTSSAIGRELAEYHTPDSLYAKAVVGSYTSGDMTIRIIYTETSTEAWRLFEAAVHDGSSVQLKWSMADSTGYTETAAGCKIRSVMPPQGIEGTELSVSEVVVWVPGFNEFTAAV
jgi:hypothetical protein